MSAHGQPVWKIALVGFGTVGSSAAKILCGHPSRCVRLTHIFNRNVARKKVDWLPAEVQWTENIEDILSADVDIVVELMGGLQPAEEWIRRALESGKSVVTANKQLIATCGPELTALAHRNNQQIFFGASVAGGVPVISGLQEGLAGDELLEICGILNGTCNYILSQIESSGVPFEHALREAQKLGFAEANPTEDVDGLDARAKLAILARLGLHCDVDAARIATRTIVDVEPIDFEYASQLGCTIRQISRAEVRDGGLLAAVGPTLVPVSSPLARVQGAQNLVMSTGIYGGETVFGGHGAGGHPTAVAVVSDILAIVRSAGQRDAPEHDTARTAVSALHEKAPHVSSDFSTRHYLRFTVKDRPGIIAALATILSQCGINIDSVLQRSGCSKSSLPFLISLEECKASLVEKALGQISTLDFLVQPCLHLPILDEKAPASR
jgi:homoserine dehydrogenase